MKKKQRVIKYKQIFDKVEGQAPFTGALVMGNTCSLKCNGCNTITFKRADTERATAKQIVDFILLNPENKGVILGGLEWSDQALDMMELAQEIQEAGLELMIQTGRSVPSFFEAIGRQSAKAVGLGVMMGVSHPEAFQHVGYSMMNHHLKKPYFLKYGGYDKRVDTTHIVQNVEVPSNQSIVYITGEEAEDVEV